MLVLASRDHLGSRVGQEGQPELAPEARAERVSKRSRQFCSTDPTGSDMVQGASYPVERSI